MTQITPDRRATSPATGAAAPDLRVDLAPHNARELILRNPVLAASGTFGYGTE